MQKAAAAKGAPGRSLFPTTFIQSSQEEFDASPHVQLSRKSKSNSTRQLPATGI
jgi:hypothetical protein